MLRQSLLRLLDSPTNAEHRLRMLIVPRRIDELYQHRKQIGLLSACSYCASASFSFPLSSHLESSLIFPGILLYPVVFSALREAMSTLTPTYARGVLAACGRMADRMDATLLPTVMHGPT
jgi:hypothetical protein